MIANIELAVVLPGRESDIQGRGYYPLIVARDRRKL